MNDAQRQAVGWFEEPGIDWGSPTATLIPGDPRTLVALFTLWSGLPFNPALEQETQLKAMQRKVKQDAFAGTGFFQLGLP